MRRKKTCFGSRRNGESSTPPAWKAGRIIGKFWASSMNIRPRFVKSYIRRIWLRASTCPARFLLPSFFVILDDCYRICRVFFAPIAGCLFRYSMTSASTSAGVFPGLCIGLLRSSSCCPAWYRVIHLLPVGRLIPYSRHSALLLASSATTRFINSSRIWLTFLSSHGTQDSSFLPWAYQLVINHVTRLNMISAPIQILWLYRYFQKQDFLDIDKIRLDILFLIQ